MTSRSVKDKILCLILTNTCVKKAIQTCALSKRYINTVLRTAVLNILYHRLNVDEEEFVTKTFNNIPFKSFRPKSNNIVIREFQTYMLACKDALDKNYLKEFYLYFIDAATGDVIENYKFSFRYTDGDEKSQPERKNNLAATTSDLLHTLEDLRKHGKISCPIQLKVEFTYFDDTPVDYEPPGFRSIDEADSLLYKLEKTGNSIKLGKLYTGFHLLKCRAIGNTFNFNESVTSTQELVRPGQYSVQAVVDTPMLTEDLSQPVNEARPVSQPVYNKMNDNYYTSNFYGDEEVKCLCKMSTMGLCIVDKIACALCKRLSHAPCEGYLDKSFVRGSTICIYCREQIGKDSVNEFDAEKLTPLYRLRFVIGVLYKYGVFPEELKDVFSETLQSLKKLNIFTKGNQITFDLEGLRKLFKFDFNMPDMNRFGNKTYEP